MDALSFGHATAVGEHLREGFRRRMEERRQHATVKSTARRFPAASLRHLNPHLFEPALFWKEGILTDRLRHSNVNQEVARAPNE